MSKLVGWPTALLLLAAMLVLPARVSAMERGAELRVSGTTTTTVYEQPVAAARQQQQVTIRGAGFRFNEPVGLWLTLPNGAVRGLDRDNIRADVAGEWSYTLRLDSSLPVGLHHLSARGKISGRGDVAPLYVQAGVSEQTVGTHARVAPGTIRAGQRLEVYGNGFNAREWVAIWITRADGVVVSLPNLRTDALGRLGGEITPPALPAGRHAITLRGNTSGNLAIAYFTREAAPTPAPETPDFVGNLGAARQGSTVEIDVSRFGRGQSLSLWLTGPDGAVTGIGDRRVPVSGRLAVSFQLGANLPPVAYVVSMRNNTTGFLAFYHLDVQPRAQ